MLTDGAHSMSAFAVAIGGKADMEFALQMSANDAKADDIAIAPLSLTGPSP